MSRETLIPHKGLAFWHLGKRSVRDRRRKANLPADSSGKSEQNDRLFFCDRRDGFRAAPRAKAESTHMRVDPAALATPRRRERSFQGSADQSGGCLTLWPQFKSGAGAQAKALFFKKAKIGVLNVSHSGRKKQTIRYRIIALPLHRLRSFDHACCKLQTGRLVQKATNRTAKAASYNPYKTPLIRTVKHRKKQLPPHEACNTATRLS